MSSREPQQWRGKSERAINWILKAGGLLQYRDPTFTELKPAVSFQDIVGYFRAYFELIPRSPNWANFYKLPPTVLATVALNDAAVDLERSARFLHTWCLPMQNAELSDTIFFFARTWNDQDRQVWKTLYNPEFRSSISTAGNLWHGCRPATPVIPIRVVCAPPTESALVWVATNDVKKCHFLGPTNGQNDYPPRDHIGYVLLCTRTSIYLLPYAEFVRRAHHPEPEVKTKAKENKGHERVEWLPEFNEQEWIQQYAVQDGNEIIAELESTIRRGDWDDYARPWSTIFRHVGGDLV